jgi:guanylate kinase
MKKTLLLAIIPLALSACVVRPARVRVYDTGPRAEHEERREERREAHEEHERQERLEHQMDPR